MRFYFGFSKKIPIKWILIVIGGLLAFFGIFKSAYALDISELNYVTAWDIGNSATDRKFSFSCGVNYGNPSFEFTNPFTNTNSDYAIFTYSSYINDLNNVQSLHDFKISFTLMASDYSQVLCEQHDGYIVCPLTKNKTYSYLFANFLNNNCAGYSNESTVYIQFSQYPNGYNVKIDSNTQAIIDNQQQQTQDIIDSNKVCKKIDKNSIYTDNSFLNTNGTIGSYESNGITDYLSLNGATLKTLVSFDNNSSYCFYNINKTLISCFRNSTLVQDSFLSFPSGASFVRFTINKSLDKPQLEYCLNGNTAIVDSQNNLNDTLNNSTVDSSSTSGGGFFDNFSVDDSRGFSSIIVAPLQFLRDLLTSSSSCSPLSFGITMQDDNINVSKNGLTFPCGDVLWSRVPAAIEVIWVTLIWGLVGYRLLLDMVKFINNSLNPEYSKEYFLEL